MWKSQVVLQWEKKNLKKKPKKKVVRRKTCSYWCVKYKDPEDTFFICPNCPQPRSKNLFIDYFELSLDSKVLDLEELQFVDLS